MTGIQASQNIDSLTSRLNKAVEPRNQSGVHQQEYWRKTFNVDRLIMTLKPLPTRRHHEARERLGHGMDVDSGVFLLTMSVLASIFLVHQNASSGTSAEDILKGGLTHREITTKTYPPQLKILSER